MPLLVFEGLDGSGKSTLIKALAQELERRGQSVLTTREPGGTPLGEEIRKWLLAVGPLAPTARAELLLYEAARAQHVDQVIGPALESGRWVLCDRYTSSSLAFQCGGRGLPEAQVESLNHFATAGRAAELTVLLEVSVTLSEARRAKRTDIDRFELEKADFHTRVRDHYLKQARAAPERWLVLEGEGQTPPELVQRVIKELEKRQWL